MHRIASLPSEEQSENLEFIQQPEAPVLFLTSASSDIATLSYVLQQDKHIKLKNNVRALQLTSLSHNAQIDHYISTTALNAKIIVVRFLGSKSDWSYGFEKLQEWSSKGKERFLLILSGTEEQDLELNGMSNLSFEFSLNLSKLLRAGGFENMSNFLSIVNELLNNQDPQTKPVEINKLSDPYKWDWRNEKGQKVGLIFYTSILNSGDYDLANEIIKVLRNNSLVPRCIWVSSLKNKSVQSEIIRLFKQEEISCILCSTYFSTINIDQECDDKFIWDILNVPILQLLTSNKDRTNWKRSSRGLNPLDFTIQVVLPEIDGRITTKIGGFKTLEEDNFELYSPIYKIKPDKYGINWIKDFILAWLSLQNTKRKNVKASIVLSNYPIKDGRIANGVGLDTPQSLLHILQILENDGYYLGNDRLPNSSKELIRIILNARTNSYETLNNKTLSYVKLDDYNEYFNSLPEESKEIIIKKWGYPDNSDDLEKYGFPISGINFGNISIIIQPSRGHNEDNIIDIHSTTIPPTHSYLAHYLWIYKINNSNLLIHLGKHGTAEWLPGKSIGLSENCYPQIIVPPIPHIYPFIVNDPGEGSQAKRRTHAVIIDHLTPPLGRAGLTSDLAHIESLLDEYNESIMLDSERTTILKEKLDLLIRNYNFTNLLDKDDNINTKDNIYNRLDSYLCEIKESQIRIGLHVFGKLPTFNNTKELILSIALTPSFNSKGLSQIIAAHLNLDLDPWLDNYIDKLTNNDLNNMSKLNNNIYANNGDLITWINDQAEIIIYYLLCNYIHKEIDQDIINKLHKKLKKLLYSNNNCLQRIKEKIIPNILLSPKSEIKSLIQSLRGFRVSSGPSGAPTRGKIEVLPTGKNFYSVDLRCIPTQAAWDLGRKSANNIIELYLLENGENLTNLAMSVWATSTMRNGGEDICQLLSLIGIRPVWDNLTSKIISLEVIPINILGRPRVDVTLRISGLFRDAFPQLIDLLNNALSMIKHLDEPSDINPYAASVNSGEPTGRIYGSAPETYGTGLQEIINLGTWETTKDLSECYLKSSQWLYNNNDDPTKDRIGLEYTLSKTNVVLHSQDNREHDILDSDDYYQFHGGLANSVEQLSGNKPHVYFSDNSKFGSPKVHSLYKEIDKVVRSRMLNDKWINGMIKHGYKGAFEMSASLDYLFAFDATTNDVPDWCYSSLIKKWLLNNTVKNFILNENPWVLRDITERLLEANNRKMWEASQEELETIKEILLESEKNIEQSLY
ncbi:cobaltochelatase subunit CobN [Prochlorococcus marinus]|uniref:cobaltochelatase subunit CobN n=1 Tax=Prochlorococcus marinus TaxID=1219 RepID=UPI0022B5B7ED|nr:cobaltochelatase subunit CobN [Prochlorococcus marinus]